MHMADCGLEKSLLGFIS